MRWPIVFISHGAPTVALDQDDYAASLSRLGARLGRPRAIVVLSAHWEAPWPARVTSAPSPPIIHDFSGFPDPLYALDYPAPGDPALAGSIVSMLESAGLRAAPEPRRGWDHGVWIPLRLIHPDASCPVVQVSLPRPSTPAELAALGRALAPLRDRETLLVGSGGIVHNLRLLRFGAKQAPVDPWARAFDAWFDGRLRARDDASILAYRAGAPHADLAVPTTEHFDPVFFTLGAAGPRDVAVTLHEGFHYGSLSMRCFELDPA